MRAGVITELAFIADEQVNAVTEGGQSDVDTPLEVQFTEFMDGGILLDIPCLWCHMTHSLYPFSKLSREGHENWAEEDDY